MTKPKPSIVRDCPQSSSTAISARPGDVSNGGALLKIAQHLAHVVHTELSVVGCQILSGNWRRRSREASVQAMTC